MADASWTEDREALQALYGATSAKLFGIAFRTLGDRGEAEDALQEIYTKVWLYADRFQPSHLSPISWLSTIVRNHSVDCLRLRRRRPADALDDLPELSDRAPTPEDAAESASLRRRLDGCLDELKPHHADAVRRFYLLGETYTEMSLHYGVKDLTLRTWVRRSLIKLRQHVDGEPSLIASSLAVTSEERPRSCQPRQRQR